jgi:polysaccharide biosynthesis/export protein
MQTLIKYAKKNIFYEFKKIMDCSMAKNIVSFFSRTRGLIISSILFITSCTPTKEMKKDLIYFQTETDSMKVLSTKEPIIQKNDLLTIQIFTKSLNQDQAIPFNMPTSSSSTTGKITGPSGPAGPTPYLVEANGDIEMPIIGAVKAAGLTKTQLHEELIEILKSFIKEPSVIIRFSDVKVNVLGEVRIPGTYNFQRERVTIIDAISAAGDITDYGKRQDITVVREENTIRKYYTVDISSGNIFQSPVYNLQSNDIIYIGPNELKFRQLRSSNGQKGLQITLAIVTVVTAIFTVIAITK